MSLSNGALSFSATDVSLPGNDALAVEVARRFSVTNRKEYISDFPLADWDLDLPSIGGVFSTEWVGGLQIMALK